MTYSRIFDLLDIQVKEHNKPDALCAKENGKWVNYSADDFIRKSRDFSYGLLHMGIKREDKIAIISNNRPEWNMADMGILQAGAIDVPIYPTVSDHDLNFILKNAEIKYVLVSSREIYDKTRLAVRDIPAIAGIYSFNRIEGVNHWSEILEAGAAHPDPEKTEAIKKSIRTEDLATILYTSGTTGNPKGVMLSHKNLMSNAQDCLHLCPVGREGKALSFLPLNHVYERMLTYVYMFKGVSIYYAESLETIGDNLKEVQPHIFSTVPRLLEKVYDRITGKGAELTGLKKNLFFWALNLGLHYELYGANGWWYELKLKLANKLIFSKWREALGGNVKVIVSGGAALQPRLARVFWSAHLHVLEGYGLTETSPVVAVNNLFPDSAKFGTVGPVINNVTVKIAEDGEILVKGPNVMMGYYKNPEATAEAIDKDGYFHTGDIGTFENGKFLKITDRKKEIFKTSGGKYITPQLIENKLKESLFIEQVMIVGENQKFAGAFIVPAFAYVKDWCKKNGIECVSNESISKDTKVITKIKEEVEKVNRSLAQYESIKRFELMPREWSIQEGELTPKLSMKRKVILEKNKDFFDKMYNQ
jgi:long-chain acyl-CoA synthetase